MHIEVVWNSFHEQLKAFVLRRARSHFDADDILQTVYVKMHSSLQNLRDEKKLRAWIFQITRNTLIDYYRKEKQLLELPEEIPFDQEIDQNLNHEISQCINGFINQLPEKYRQAIQLTQFSGYSQKQLSEQLGISFSGAKSRVQRGRQKLKEMITDCCRLEMDRFGNVLDYQPQKNGFKFQLSRLLIMTSSLYYILSRSYLLTPMMHKECENRNHISYRFRKWRKER